MLTWAPSADTDGMASTVQPWFLREQLDSDEQELAQLLVRVDAAWDGQPFRQSVRDGGLPAALDVMRRPRIAGMVAVLDGAIVGCAALRDVEGSAHLVNVMVDPSCEGRGIGRELVITMCQRAVLRGLDVCLDVLDGSMRARALYDSIGFRPIELTRGKVTGRPGTLMRLELGWL